MPKLYVAWIGEAFDNPLLEAAIIVTEHGDNKNETVGFGVVPTQHIDLLVKREIHATPDSPLENVLGCIFLEEIDEEAASLTMKNLRRTPERKPLAFRLKVVKEKEAVPAGNATRAISVDDYKWTGLAWLCTCLDAMAISGALSPPEEWKWPACEESFATYEAELGKFGNLPKTLYHLREKLIEGNKKGLKEFENVVEWEAISADLSAWFDTEGIEVV